jgi:hypothetical protein
MRSGRALAGVVFCALAVAAAAPAEAQYRVLETDHLRLLYPGATLGYLAPYTAQCFENSMGVHRRLFGYESREKVNVILDDFEDHGNAGVWVNPRNSMVVHIAPTDFIYETNPANERINHTMNHEVVHVVALDEATASDRWARRMMGGKVRESSDHPETMLYQYFTVPRRAAPRWYHEGIAVFLETWLAGGLGRAQGPYDEMVFRAMVRDSAHFYDPLGLESAGTKVDFQVGANSYLYGTRFMTYLAYRYSPDTLMRWIARRPGSRAYFASQFRQVFGRSLDQGWREWIRFERDFQRANLDSVRRAPVTGSHDLSRLGLGSVSRAYVDSARGELIAAVFHPGDFAHLAAIPLDGRPPRKLLEIKGPALYSVASLAFDRERRVLYYTTDNNDWRDLCSLDLVTGKSKRLIKDARIGDLAFDRSSRALWGIRHFNGFSTLVRLAPPYRQWKQIRTWPYGEDPYDLDLSPDGKLLAASVGEISGRQTLRLMRPDSLARGDTSSTTLYDFGNAIPTNFVFSPDGRRLYGSSYYTGVSNIFRYDLAADSMEVLSNAETGFFRPIPGAGDSLLVFRYTGQGFVPSRIAERPLQDVSAITFLGNATVQRHPVLERWIAPSPASVRIDSLTRFSGPYRSFSRMTIASMFPIVEGYKDQTSIGAQVEFSDPFSLHQAFLSASVTPAGHLPDDERWHAGIGYKRYNLDFHAQYNGASFYDLFGPTKTSRKGYGGSLVYRRSLIRDQPRLMELTAGASLFAKLERLIDNQNVATSSDFDKVVAPQIAIDDKKLGSSIGAADYEKGYEWRLEATSNIVRFVRPQGATWRDFPQATALLDLGTPLPIRNSSLWLRTAAGYSPGERAEPFSNFFFGGFGNNWVDHGEVKRYRQIGSFPGTPLDAVGGTNFGRVMIDWNLPAIRFERLGTLAFYASWARLSLFGSGLATNLDDSATRQRLGNVGAQADVRFQFLTQETLTLSAGYARSYRRRFFDDEWMVSLKIL